MADFVMVTGLLVLIWVGVPLWSISSSLARVRDSLEALRALAERGRR